MASSPKGHSSDAHATQTGTVAHGGEHGGHGGFPPFDPSTFAPQLVWLTITFVALYYLMSRLALPAVSSVLTERRERIQRDLAEAEKLKTETDEALAAYEKSLSDARSKAQGMAKDMRDKLANEMESARRSVDETNAAKLAETEARIAETKSKALASVNDLAADTASAIVERLIGQPVSAEDVQK
ncbi:MAG: ATP F0F1 synthase subunit B, partial [Hyphomicrobiaceae bacterium]